MSTNDFIFTSIGENLERKINAVPNNRIWALTFSASDNFKYMYYIKIEPSPITLYFSNDYGNTWSERLNYPLTSWEEQRILHVSGNGKCLIIPTEYRTLISSDYGQTWISNYSDGFRHTSAKERYPNSISMSYDGSFMIIGTPGDVFNGSKPMYSTNYGVTWQTLNSFPGINLTSDTAANVVEVSRDGNIVFIGNLIKNNSKYYIWNRLTNVCSITNTPSTPSNAGIRFIRMSNDGKYIYIFSHTRFHISIDYGTTFRNFNEGIYQSFLRGVYGACASYSGKYVMMIGWDKQDNGIWPNRGKLCVSDDYGKTWTKKSISFSYNAGRLFCTPYANKILIPNIYDNAGNEVLVYNNPINMNSGVTYSPLLLKEIGLSDVEILSMGYTSSELRIAGFTALQLFDASYNVTQLKDGGYSFIEIKTVSGLSDLEFKNLGFTSTYFKSFNYSAVSLNIIGFTIYELKLAGYNVTEMRTVPFTAQELKNVGYTSLEMKNGGFTASQLKDVGYTLSELKTADYSATELKPLNYTLSELKGVNYTATELKTAGFTATEMKLEFNLDTLKIIGFVVNDLKTLYSNIELKNVGFTSTEMKQGGFTSQQLYILGYTATQLKIALYPVSEVLLLGYTSSQIKEAGYTIRDLRTYGYSIQQVVEAGFNATDLFNEGFSVSQIGTQIYTSQQLRLAGYTASNLLNGGFSLQMVAQAGYSVSILRTTNRSGFTPLILKNAGYTIPQLRDVTVTPSFSLTELLSATYQVNEIRLSGFASITQIKNSGFYTRQQIVSGGYTASMLRSESFTANELINNYTPTDLRLGGYTDSQILLAGFSVFSLKTLTNPQLTILQLKNALYTPLQLKDASYNDTDILSGGFDASLLELASYSARQLRVNNYTLSQLIAANYSTNEILNAGFTALSLNGTYSSVQLKSYNYTVSDLISGSYNLVDILTAGYSTNELRLNGFTVSQLKPYYSVLDIKNGGYDNTLILKGGFTPVQLKSANFSASELKPYYSILDLKNSGINGYTTSEILSAKYPVFNIKQAGYMVSQAKEFYTISELKFNNIYTDTEILKGGFTASQLKDAGYTASQLKQNNYLLNDLILAGYSDTQILQAKYSAIELKSVYLITKLVEYNYSIVELQSAGYTSIEIINSGFTASQLKEAGFTASQLKEAGYTALELRNALYADEIILGLGYTVSQLLTAFSYTSVQLKENNYAASELKENNFTDSDILSINYSSLVLKNVGYNLYELKQYNYTAKQIRDALYNDVDILNAGFSVIQLKDAGFIPDELKEYNYNDNDILSAGYSANVLKNSGYSVVQLKNSNYTINELQLANYNDDEILNAEFNAYDLKTIGQYNATQLKNANYTSFELRIAEYLVQELKEAGFDDNEILGAGYFAEQLRLSNYTSLQLKSFGYTAKQLKIGGYTDVDILSVGYTSTELLVAGYTSSELINNGYSDSQILSGLISITEVLPQAPILLNAIPENGSVLIYFNIVDEASNKIFGFKYSIDGETYLWAEQNQSPINIKGLTNGQLYNIYMKSVNSSGDSLPSDSYLSVTPLNNPSPPNISNIIELNNSLEVEFVEGNSNGSQITHYYYSINDMSYNEVTPLNNKFIISNLLNGTTYSIKMKVSNVVGMSSPSLSKTGTPLSLPNPPIINSVIGLDKRLIINFTPGNNNGSQILYYKYSLDQINYYFTEQNISPFIIKDLSNNTEFNVSLINSNIVGESVASNILSGKTLNILDRPIIVETTPYNNTSILITLLDDTYDINNTFYYSLNELEYKEVKILIDNNLLITEVPLNENYTIKVKSYNGNLFSPESNIYQGILYSPPEIPDITNIIPGDNEALVYFQNNNLDASSVLYYEYKVNEDPTIYFLKSLISPIYIYGLTNGLNTTIQLRGVSLNGFSDFSLPSVMFVPYGKPFTPTITKILPGNNSAYIYIDTSSNISNGSDIINYEYYNGSNFIPIQGTNSPLYLPNIINKNKYDIGIVANNKAGQSLISNVIECIPGTPMPPTITNVIAGPESGTIYFTTLSNNGSLIIYYQYKLNNGPFVRITGLNSPFTINNLKNATTYTIQINAVNSNGESLLSNEISFSPFSIPNRMQPPVITPISGNSQTSNATIQFTPPYNNGSEIIKYVYCINNSLQEFDINSLSSPATINGLPINSNYTIKIKAYNAAGGSILSSESNISIFKHGPPDKIIISSISTSFRKLTVNFTQPQLNNGTLQKYMYSLNGSSYINYPNLNLPLVIDNLTNNINYNIQFKAVSNLGESIESNLLNTPVKIEYLSPNPPVITSIIGKNKTLIINFIPSIIRGAPVVAYYYSFDGINLIRANGNLTSPIYITGLQNNINYNIRLYADSLADISLSSNIIVGTPKNEIPTIPVINKIEAFNTTASISFTPSIPNGSEIIDYIYTLNQGETFVRINKLESPFIITDLINDISYNIQMACLSDIGVTEYSLPITFTPIYTVPTKPIINKITSTKNSANISFNASSANGGNIFRYLYTFDGGITQINTNAIITNNIGTFELVYLEQNIPYAIQLIAENELGKSELSEPYIFTCVYTVPNPPTINSNILTTKSSAIINFTSGSANNGIISNHYYSLDNGITYTPINKITSPFIINDLSSNILYTIRMKTENELGLSIVSLSKNFTCIYTVPNPPTINSNITTTKNTATINFTSGSANNGVISNHYYSLDNGITYTPINKTSGSFTISDLSSNTPYTIIMKSENELGLSIASGSRTFTCIYTVPNAPTINTNITTTKNTATINFTSGSANNGVISNHYYSLDNGITYIPINKIIGPFTISDLSSNIQYTIIMKSENELGLSVASESRTFTCIYTVPNVPTINSNITTTKNNATINFTSGSANNGVISNHYYSLDNGITYIPINKITGPFTISDLSSNIQYTIRMKTENELGLSNVSINRTFTCIHTVPNAPTINNIITTKNSATISFTSGSANNGVISNQYYSLNNGVTFIPINKTTSPFTINDLSFNIQYTIIMKTENELGLSIASGSRTFIYNYTVPTQPTIGIIRTNKNRATVSFVPGSSGNGTFINHYYSIDNSYNFIATNVMESPYLFTIENIATNIPIEIVMRSENELGFSNISTYKTFTSIYTVPNNPVIVSAVVDASNVTVSFVPGYDNFGTISAYYYTLNNGETFINTGSLSTSFSIELLPNTYNIRLSSENELGISPLSQPRELIVT